MKKLLTIFTVLVGQVCNSQTLVDVKYFHSLQANSDSSLNYFISFLNVFDATNAERNFWCEMASERVGDYYFSKGNYVKAIAYFDSADTKYRNKSISCGNAYYIEFIPRLYKISQSYLALNDLTKAISTLTPYIFGCFSSPYFDSTMTTYYQSLITSLYCKEEIENHLEKAVKNIQYTPYYRYAVDSSKYLSPSYIIKLFGTEVELSSGGEYEVVNGKIDFIATMEFRLQQLQNIDIYKRLLH